MKEFIEALLDVYNAFKSIGYDPVPTFLATATLFLARERWVRPILSMKLTREKAVALRDRYKDRIMWASAAVAAVSSWAATAPANTHTYIMWACWIVGHTAAASLLYDYLASKKWMKHAGTYVAPKPYADPDPGEGGL